MLLTSLHIQNYRCFEDLGPIPIHRLTVFIGENDAGKTGVASALEVLLENVRIAENDYRIVNDRGERAEEIRITGQFEVGEEDHVPPDLLTPEGVLRITKVFTPDADACFVEGRKFVDARWTGFAGANANEQKSLLESIGIEEIGSNKDIRQEQFEQAQADDLIPKEPGEVPIKFSEVADFLPRYECIASAEYKHPESMIQRNLRSVADDFMHPVAEGGEAELRPELAAVRTGVKDALDREINRMREALQRANPRLVNIEVDPEIDFARSVTAANLLVDQGQGFRRLSAFGEGTHKKLWMGLLDWQQESSKERTHRPVLRVYDEPDVNLDYSAERKLFSSILETTRDPEARTQTVVCTHSVTMVDRAPPESIKLISVSPDDGARTVEYLEISEDDEVRDFLSGVGTSVGLSNSAFFYERCFLLVEGESEDASLPILYRNLYGRAPIEDGIVLINLESCGAWRSVLSVLLRHKSEITVLLLDRDCTAPNSGANVTKERLAEVGYPESYLKNQCVFIGEKEFEDAFHTDDIVAVLNDGWPKQNGDDWTAAEIERVRATADKFSRELLDTVRVTCVLSKRNAAKKPQFATALAHQCRTNDQVPEDLRKAFRIAQKLARSSEAG